jgi:hypothetical protein
MPYTPTTNVCHKSCTLAALALPLQQSNRHSRIPTTNAHAARMADTIKMNRVFLMKIVMREMRIRLNGADVR